MNLRQRLDEIRQLAEKASPALRVVVDCNAVLALLEVVEQQHRALEAMVREFGYEVVHPQGLVHDEHEAIRKATAALSLLDKEES